MPGIVACKGVPSIAKVIYLWEEYSLIQHDFQTLILIKQIYADVIWKSPVDWNP